MELVTADGEAVELRRGVPARGRALDRFEEEAAPLIHAASADIAARFPRTRKNSSGYALDHYLATGDPLDLVIGAEGTLGVITAVEWRLGPVPPAPAGSTLPVGHWSRWRSWWPPCSDPTIGGRAADRTFLELVGEKGAEAVILRQSGAGRRRRRCVRRSPRRRVWRGPRPSSVDSGLTQQAAQRLSALRRAQSPVLTSLPGGAAVLPRLIRAPLRAQSARVRQVPPRR